MNPPRAILSAFRNYLNLSGRASRSEYWWFYLFFAVGVVSIFVASVAWRPALFPLWVAFLVVMAPPLWAVTVRRLHDMDKPGYWAFVGFMPLVGGPKMTRLLALPGTVGPNRYGPDPLRPDPRMGASQPPARDRAETTAQGTTPARQHPPGDHPGDPHGASHCPQCGWKRWPDASFCADCGAAL